MVLLEGLDFDEQALRFDDGCQVVRQGVALVQAKHLQQLGVEVPCHQLVHVHQEVLPHSETT